MNSELSDAYFGVYSSSKEILKNNQRHLFCNMLDLLANTCKTTGITCNKIPDDDQVLFWISNILPLVFDEDSSIQSSAAAALEQGLLHLSVATIHGSIHWGLLKNNIILKMANQINRMREDKNDFWHRIWCFLIQILDREILKGASTINIFLSIVELGFRSPDNKIRAEAFHCWRLLIKIFSKYNELSSPKRMKLICIPLKSSQSKSAHSAEIKLRVWWYVFSCLESKLEQFFENVVEPFFVFAFGSVKVNITPLIQQYPSKRELALTSLALLISTENNSFLDRTCREFSLEHLAQPSPLLKKTVFENYWQPIANAVVEALKLFNDEYSLSDTEQQLLHLIVKFFAVSFIRFDISSYRFFMLDELYKFSHKQGKPIIPFFNVFVSEGYSLESSIGNFNINAKMLNKFLKLLHKFKTILPRTILENSIGNLLKISASRKDALNAQNFTQILNVVMESNDDLDFDLFEIKLLMWRKTSLNLINYYKENKSHMELKEYTLSLNNWILWPVRIASSFAGRRCDLSCDTFFWNIWKQTVLFGQDLSEQRILLTELKELLNEIVLSGKNDDCISELYDVFVAASSKYGLEKEENLREAITDILRNILKHRSASKILEGCLNTFMNLICGLTVAEFNQYFDTLKTIVSEASKSAERGNINSQYFEGWKRALLEKVKGFPNKSLLSQTKDLFKSNDVFVIIPSVWSLNPEKLTERQKERYSEKDDIPALYNDMSQSQDSSIKPWTPKKIVLVKEDQKEISFENSSTYLKDNERSYTSSECNEGKEYNFRKRSNIGDHENIMDNEDANTVTQRTLRSNIKTKPNDELSSKSSVISKSALSKFPVESTDTNELITENVDTILNDELRQTTNELVDLSKSLKEQKSDIEDMNDFEKETNQISQAIEDEQNLSGIAKQFEVVYEIKELSPKKNIPPKLSSLSSPPDRKSTNNSSSPTLRPKPAAHLTGRGAQLINMIRNKKLESQHTSVKVSNSINIQLNPKEEKRIEGNPINNDMIELSRTENTSTPLVTKDLLIFSKRLPSPTASPSASILKRKLRRDSIDEMSIESPALKRKRVSFHDPPVSVTKEYIKDSDDPKTKLKRCLNLDKQNQCNSTGHTPEVKHALKRRSKLDSILEIEKYGAATPPSSVNGTEKTYEISSLKWDESFNSTSTPNNLVPENFCRTSNSSVSAINVENALELVFTQCSIETILEKLLSTEKNHTTKTSHLLSKFISNQMSKNAKTKDSVLETLSENHSKDFLDYAIQENLSSVVCDRLNLNSVIDYVCAKSKINTSCRNNLLLQIPDILKSSKVDSEKLNFYKTMLSSCELSDENILDIISMLMNLRRKAEDRGNVCVSESAVDSSSNL